VIIVIIGIGIRIRWAHLFYLTPKQGFQRTLLSVFFSLGRPWIRSNHNRPTGEKDTCPLTFHPPDITRVSDSFLGYKVAKKILGSHYPYLCLKSFILITKFLWIPLVWSEKWVLWITSPSSLTAPAAVRNWRSGSSCR